ncbi:MAG TPA: HAD family hydrolase [Spirochaetia bacterium]|mgnify:CR=1 FL=1|nr:HAD family hydrolase [Spirochaetia bacterium]
MARIHTPSPCAILFDLDGTLLDSIADITASVNRAIGRFGFPPRSESEYRRAVGDGIEELIRRMLPPEAVKDPRFPKIRDTTVREYREDVTRKTRPYPGILSLLDTLSEAGIPLGILTNKPEELALKSVTALLPSSRFITVKGAVPGTPAKPDPGKALEIAALFGRPPAQVLLVGDSEIDILTARNAGMISVAVSWGFREREKLKQYHPRYLIDAPEDLLSILDTLTRTRDAACDNKGTVRT